MLIPKAFVVLFATSLGFAIFHTGVPQSGQLNIKHFGAAGDGRTDDTKAIQAALDVAGQNGGTVFVPTGRYLVSRTLRVTGDGVTIHGDGPLSVFLMAPRSVSPDNRHLLYVTANRFLISDMALDGQGSTQTQLPYTELIQLGTELANGRAANPRAPLFSELTIRNVKATNAVAGQLRAFRTIGLTIADNTFIGVTRDISILAHNVQIGWSKNFLVASNLFDLGFPRLHSNNVIVGHTGNTNSSSQQGQITANLAARSLDSPIEASGSTARSRLRATVRSVEIDNNVIYQGAGIVSLQSHDVSIHDNVILRPGDVGGNNWAVKLGCSMFADSTVSESDITVANNVVLFGDSTHAGVMLYTDGCNVTNIFFSQNTFDAPAEGCHFLFVQKGDGTISKLRVLASPVAQALHVPMRVQAANRARLELELPPDWRPSPCADPGRRPQRGAL